MGQCISLPLSLPEKDQDSNEFLGLLRKMHLLEIFPNTNKKRERGRERNTLLISIIPLHNGIYVLTKRNTIAKDLKGGLKTIKITVFCAVCGIH